MRIGVILPATMKLEGRITGPLLQEFIRFLNAIEAEVPAGKMVHVILDNYATHKHPRVRVGSPDTLRFVFHFTPTSCSWINAVETFFAKLTTSACEPDMLVPSFLLRLSRCVSSVRTS